MAAVGAAQEPNPWPVKPGLKLIPKSRLDTRSDEEIISGLQIYRAVSDEKNIWAFWHSGIAKAPLWSQRTVVSWIRRMPSWTVRILDNVPGSTVNVHNFVNPAFLPDAFHNNTMTGPHIGQHSADLIRLPLLYQHGGVWMDVGIILFRDLEEICWRALSDPQIPYEMAGFSIHPPGSKKTFANSFIAARKGNPFIKRWFEIYLEAWKGVTEQKGMHAHPLFKRQTLPPAAKNLKLNEDEQRSKLQDQGMGTTGPETNSQDLLDRKALADYIAQFLCFDRLSRLHDPSDDFNGSEYLNSHALVYDGMQESLLAQHLTHWNTEKQFEYLCTKKQNDKVSNDTNDDERYREAEAFTEALVTQSCQMKVCHGIEGAEQLGLLWERPGAEDADYAEGTFAAYVRYASVFLEQTREMKSQPWGPAEGEIWRLGVTEI